ncbi:FMN-dependent NADH-azoreductase [Pasteurella caecimuris]|uniref:FMN-dependent NADH-azoreductase n=1 Tax=Rodentibacter pneumotropicus TaxID=758 RepID=A0A4S2Q1W8_9PAST|nr:MULTISPECIES: FMN-dependent NADH-azoreductase [Pasteurellaceae]MCR1838635.1 FMN-dependent NADH-azoreductase [Pasteurella caecimuris]MCU0108063.1 FMN-dependent NADH-azoreductase [Pasteurella caecimuris]THA10470.1 FMN-dependent NADH-azoreductase [Rodentibacter pneumotropicus]
MKKTDVAQQIVDIQTLLEIAKDNLLEDKNDDALKVLHRASLEMKTVAWRIAPILEG